MKARLLFLFLFLCLTWSGWAESFTPYSRDSLKKGDWFTFECVNYYPYVAPGIKEEIPWRAENIRRVIIRATVTDRTDKSISIDYTLDNLYDCHNDQKKQGFYYFDSRYQQDFAFKDSVSGKQILHATYDRKSGKALISDKVNSLYSYSKAYIPFGVRQEGLSTYTEVSVHDSLDLEKLVIPTADNLLTGWKKDVPNFPVPNTRIIEASFPLPPNTEFTCCDFDIDASGDSTIHKKIFIPYPTEYKVGKRVTLLLTPGDSIVQDKEVYANTHTFHYEGRGNEQNNLQYNFMRFSYYNSEFYSTSPADQKKAFQSRDSLFQTAFEKDFKKMDPYWRRVFELSEEYFKGSEILRRCMFTTDKDVWRKSGLPDWQAPYFTSVSPLIDYAYSLKKQGAANYNYFLYVYTIYKKQELKSDNLYLNKQKGLTQQEDYLLTKQILSGYPKYQVNKVNLKALMGEKMLSELEADYKDFISSCPDTSLTNDLKNTYNKLLPFEAGKNIKETGLSIADSLHLAKGNNRKYILLQLLPWDGLPANNLQNALDLKQRIEAEGLTSTIQLELYSKFSSHNAEKVKPYKVIPNQQVQDLKSKGIYPLTILMREDGTILYRRLWDFDIDTIIDLVKKDLNREDKSFNDFIKGFKEGVIGALLLAAIIGLIYYFRTKNKQKQELNRRRIRELELRAIRSQMNPHFIFNALSSIQNLINRSANQEANKYLIDFSRLLRKVLATSEKKLVTLSDEIEQLQLYLKLEQLRFPFSYSLTVDENIQPDTIEIPGMLIQPFVENAVKHGIAPRGTGEIIIRLSLQNQLLIIDITDDGPGLDTDANGGFGIRAVTNEFEILKTLYNTEIGVTIENRQEKDAVSGCHIRLSIPL
ncbi:histidine kinase [Parabacteroides faecis]|uniref:sensor histidine kinase n=1 Tax=Parabacteroides TaxID=375288 RepID=UPI000EFF1F71|nr:MULTISPECIES: histidine kinase [Parabacteroides]MBC8616896.1 histidine kinase [Parabacteroides faecis]RHR94417.1 sensor histidine kinase [Parabacteroides sp. AF14-59]